jgi:hypothetical protein
MRTILAPAGWILKRARRDGAGPEYYAGGAGHGGWTPDIQQAHAFTDRSEALVARDKMFGADREHIYSILTGRRWPPPRESTQTPRERALAELDETMTNLRLELPERPQVEEIRWQEIIDSLGDGALDFIVVLAPHTPDQELRWERLKPISDVILQRVHELGLEDFPYVHFVNRDELEDQEALA